MINMLRVLMDKVDSMQEQMDNVSRGMEILRKNQKEMLEIKNTVAEMKTAFGRFINRSDMAKERISEREDILLENSKPENQTEQRLEKQLNRMSKDCWTTTESVTYMQWEYQKKKERRKKWKKYLKQ